MGKYDLSIVIEINCSQNNEEKRGLDAYPSITKQKLGIFILQILGYYFLENGALLDSEHSLS